MRSFERAFSILLEQPELPPAPRSTGEPSSDRETIDAIGNDVSDNPAIAYKKNTDATHSTSIKDWINKIDQFKTDLNGLTPDSMNSQLNSSDEDSLFAAIASTEGKHITRIAKDLSGLSEILKGYLLASDGK